MAQSVDISGKDSLRNVAVNGLGLSEVGTREIITHPGGGNLSRTLPSATAVEGDVIEYFDKDGLITETEGLIILRGGGEIVGEFYGIGLLKEFLPFGAVIRTPYAKVRFTYLGDKWHMERLLFVPVVSKTIPADGILSIPFEDGRFAEFAPTANITFTHPGSLDFIGSLKGVIDNAAGVTFDFSDPKFRVLGTMPSSGKFELIIEINQTDNIIDVSFPAASSGGAMTAAEIVSVLQASSVDLEQLRTIVGAKFVPLAATTSINVITGKFDYANITQSGVLSFTAANLPSTFGDYEGLFKIDADGINGFVFGPNFDTDMVNKIPDGSELEAGEYAMVVKRNSQTNLLDVFWQGATTIAPSLLEAPTSVVVSARATGADISWVNNGSGQTSNIIRVGTSSGGPYTDFTFNAGASDTSDILDGLSVGTNYFAVVASSDGSSEVASSEVSFTTNASSIIVDVDTLAALPVTDAQKTVTNPDGIFSNSNERLVISVSGAANSIPARQNNVDYVAEVASGTHACLRNEWEIPDNLGANTNGIKLQTILWKDSNTRAHLQCNANNGANGLKYYSMFLRTSGVSSAAVHTLIDANLHPIHRIYKIAGLGDVVAEYFDSTLPTPAWVEMARISDANSAAFPDDVSMYISASNDSTGGASMSGTMRNLYLTNALYSVPNPYEM